MKTNNLLKKQNNRNNSEWIEKLKLSSPDCNEVISDLRDILTKGLKAALLNRYNIDTDLIEDFVQEAILKIIDKLDTFRGESQFITWATRISINLALSQLRKKQWQDYSLDNIDTSVNFTSFLNLNQKELNPEKIFVQNQLIENINKAINEDLTEHQKKTFYSIIMNNIPMCEIASRLGTNRNSLYKTMHDIRKNLKKSLLKLGLTVNEILNAFE